MPAGSIHHVTLTDGLPEFDGAAREVNESRDVRSQEILTVTKAHNER